MPVSYVCDRCGFPVLRGPAGCWVHASAGDAAFCAAFAGVSLTPSADLPACRDELAAFADEALEWAELTLPTALEGWPDE